MFTYFILESVNKRACDELLIQNPTQVVMQCLYSEMLDVLLNSRYFLEKYDL